MKILHKITIICSIMFISNAFAMQDKKDEAKNLDYYSNYYDNEGSLLFKIRGFYVTTNAKPTGLPDVKNQGASKPGRIADNGYGFDTAMTIFATDNIAAEISLGLGLYNTKASALSAAVEAYGSTGASSPGKRNQIFMVPFTIAAQYHIAPFGAIRPYVGAGYNATYMHTRSKHLKVNSTTGPVLQLGVDFIAKNDTLFTFDVRQYFLKSGVKFRKELLGTDDIDSKVKWNPLVISLGFGFKF